MKPIKILLTFLFFFTSFFILERIYPSHFLKSGEPIIEQIFKYIFQSLNLTLLVTFLDSFRKIKKLESIEIFKAQRKNLIISFFLFTWIITVFLKVVRNWILKHETDCLKSIYYSLLWAIISLLISLLFSGAFRKGKPSHRTDKN